VGDVDAILERDRVGVTLSDSTEGGRREAMRALVALSEEPDVKARCVAAAFRTFSLADGVRAYDALYRELGARA
jgi:glycogen synthase